MDFSFSGIKTAVLRHVRSRQVAGNGQPAAGQGAAGSRQLAVGDEAARASGFGLQASGAERLATGSGQQAADAAPLSRQEIAGICASFQRAVIEALLDRTFEAASRAGARSVGIAGGVSANSRLRADSQARGARMGLPVFVPPLALSTDNAAMIAAAGLRRFHMGVRANWDLNADASLRL